MVLWITRSIKRVGFYIFHCAIMYCNLIFTPMFCTSTINMNLMWKDLLYIFDWIFKIKTLKNMRLLHIWLKTFINFMVNLYKKGEGLNSWRTWMHTFHLLEFRVKRTWIEIMINAMFHRTNELWTTMFGLDVITLPLHTLHALWFLHVSSFSNLPFNNIQKCIRQLKIFIDK